MEFCQSKKVGTLYQDNGIKCIAAKRVIAWKTRSSNGPSDNIVKVL